MDLNRLLAELARHQDAIVAHLAVTRKLLALPPETALPDLARRRWELARLLRAYQLFKHGELFDPPIRRRAAQAPLAIEMKARCVAMGGMFEAHIRRWASSDAASVWREYTRDETAMIDRLRGHLLREREEARRLVPAVATSSLELRPSFAPARDRRSSAG